MMPVEIKKGLWQLPVVDWNVRDFHGYSVYQGTTYNTYLAVGDKITLFDTVKKDFAGDLLGMIAKIVDPAKIDYIVVNHAEPDHSGALPAIVEAVCPEKIFCSAVCKNALMDHFHDDTMPFSILTNGSETDIGGRTLYFMETRMLHWPDSCFSYLKEDKVLISSDAFGHHWATSERYDDEVDFSKLMRQCAKYYANIILPYSNMVQKVLSSVSSLNLEIDVIAPDHGLMWRKNIPAILSAYDEWSRHCLKNKAVIVYDTMWKSTEKMALSILDGLKSEGINTELMSLTHNHRSEVMTDILDASVVVFGSPTLNNGMLPSVNDMLCYMKGLKPAGGRIGGLFGSYGWSGEAVAEMKEYMVKAGLEMPEEPLKTKYVPDSDVLDQCFEYGRTLARHSAAKICV